MPSYFVTWEIDIEADDPRAAALEAFACMQRPGTTATVFDVFLAGETADPIRIDLGDQGDDFEAFQ